MGELLPIPSITGGSAGNPFSESKTGANFIYSNSGNSGAWLFISIAAIVGLVVWKRKNK